MYEYDGHASTAVLRDLELHVHLIDGHVAGRELTQQAYQVPAGRIAEHLPPADEETSLGL